MRKYLIYVFILSVAIVYGQKREFKNQGEQEDYWAEQLFEQKYIKQSFEKFKGTISIIDKTNIKFDNNSLEIWSVKHELLEIFTEGVFYPQIIIGHEKTILSNPNLN